MASFDSRAIYAERIHRVLAHIDEHIDEPLDLVRLAAVAHFSEYHFHRLFAAWMDETLGDYLRRRRLELAAMRMIAQPGLPVLQVALSVGWGSGEAFARAFKQRFEMTPSQWKRQSKEGQAASKHGQERLDAVGNHGSPSHSWKELIVNVTLIDRSDIRIAYRRHTGPYGPSVYDFWINEVAPWLETNGLMGNPRYGISHDDPSITDPNKCRYDAAVEVDNGFVAGPGVFVTTLPGGRYAAMPFLGTSDEISGAWQRLLRDWLADSGLQLDSRPCFEAYAPDSPYDPESGEFGCHIVVPIAPL